MNFLQLTKDKLDIAAISDIVADESCGAISIFAGTTRDNFEDKKVLCLEYEAYEPMAIKVMTKICDEIRSKWPDIKNIAIYHRLDIVPVKEASVVIAISSPHRQSSLQSVQFAIDELKRSVPIWKKEKYENSGESWKANKECKNDPLRKRQKLNFDECKIEVEPIPENLIQIKANDSEIKRRINYFIEKKREEIDVNNILDYTANKLTGNNCDAKNNEDNDSCARLNSVLIKRNDSKGHLRVRRVQNKTGPNDHNNYTRALNKLMENLSNKISNNDNKNEDKGNNFNNDRKLLPTGVTERIENIEKYLNINLPAPKTVYERLKKMEDKILFLETISPEYRHFVTSMDMRSDVSKNHIDTAKNHPTNKKIFTVNDLNGYIKHIKERISKEIKIENE